MGEKVSLSWMTSPYFELREKIKCIEHLKLLPEILKMLQNFFLSESSRLTPVLTILSEQFWSIKISTTVIECFDFSGTFWSMSIAQA